MQVFAFPTHLNSSIPSLMLVLSLALALPFISYGFLCVYYMYIFKQKSTLNLFSLAPPTKGKEKKNEGNDDDDDDGNH